MSNRIKIRRGNTKPTTSNLLNYELGWDTAQHALYINNGGGIAKVGGTGLFLELTGGTLTGTLYTNTIVRKSTTTPWPYILFSGIDYTGDTYTTKNQNSVYLYAQLGGSTRVSDGSVYRSTTFLRHYSINSSTYENNGHFETYYLPSCTDDLTTDINYTVITTKNPESLGYYLPLTGGTMTGTLIMGTTSQVNGSRIYFYSKNTDSTATRYVWLGYANGANTWYLYDGTNSAGIITSTADGTNTFYGLASSASAIRIADTTPTGGTSYYINFTTGKTSGSNYSLRANSLIRTYIHTDGEYVYIALGDSSHYGGITFNAGNGYYANLRASNSLTANRLIQLPDIAGTIAVGDFLPLNGGTMNDEKSITFKITRKKDGGGGWAYVPLRFIGDDGNRFYNIGVYGTANSLTYGYIGIGDYGEVADLRIYPSGDVRANGCSVIRDSGTTARKIWVTTTNSKPANAVDNDIVLVKV